MTTLRERLLKERDRAAEKLADPAGVKATARMPVVNMMNRDAENIRIGFNAALGLLWPVVERIQNLPCMRTPTMKDGKMEMVHSIDCWRCDTLAELEAKLKERE